MAPLFRTHFVQKAQQSNFISCESQKGAYQLLMPKDFYPSRTGLESPGHDHAPAHPRGFFKARFQPSNRNKTPIILAK